jgi:hypothetical protein
MAWEIFTPESRVRVKQPRAQIIVSGKIMTLQLNHLLCRELGFNSLTKCALLRYDRERNVMGLTFHQKTTGKSLRIGKRTMLDTSISRTVNVAKFLYDILPDRLANGTYNLSYSREKDILVLELNSLTKTDDLED